MNEHRPVFLKPLYEVRVDVRDSRFSCEFMWVVTAAVSIYRLEICRIFKNVEVPCCIIV